MPQSELVQSVLKALDILRAVAEAPNGLRLNEIAERFEMKTSTAHNLVRTLRARGFLDKDAANRFLPGAALPELARHSGRSRTLEAAGETLRKLGRIFPKAVLTFSELTPGAIFCRLRVSPDRPGELQTPLDQRINPYTSVTALVLQSTGLNAAEFERVYPFEEYGAVRWGTPEALAEARKNVRRNGFALWPGARTAIAVAIPEHFAIGLSTEDPLAAIPPELSAAAAALKQKLESAQ